MPHEALNRLVPRPQEMRLTRGSFEWTEGIILAIEPGNTADRLAAQTVVEHLRERGIVPPRDPCNPGGAADPGAQAGAGRRPVPELAPPESHA